MTAPKEGGQNECHAAGAGNRTKEQEGRGGGRDRDQIVRHTFAAELDWAKKLGLLTPLETMLTDAGLSAYRDVYCDAIRTLHVQGQMARTWPLRSLIQHTAFHTLDHAWKMEDKDLTAKRV
jgi:hypothetical protein